MSAAEELAQMQEEWRKEVRGRFDKLESALNEHGKRVSTVEGNQKQVFGGLVVLQAIGTWVLSKFTNHNT